MSRGSGHRLPAAVRRQAIQTLQGLLAAGVEDAEARQQIAGRYNVTGRTARAWLAQAYGGLQKDTEIDRDRLRGVALRRRRLAMARAAKQGDWKTYLSAAESEAKLLGLNAPQQTEHHVLVEKVHDLTTVVLDVVRDHFLDDPVGRDRFVRALRERVSAALARRPGGPVIDIDVGDADRSPDSSRNGQQSIPASAGDS